MIRDDFFGGLKCFTTAYLLPYPLSQQHDGVVKIRYQAALTRTRYPPTVKVVYLNEVGSGAVADTDTTSESNDAAASHSEQFDLAQRLIDKDNLALTLALFFAQVDSLTLACSPCTHCQAL